MSVETDSPDHGGRNPYPARGSRTDAPPGVVDGNGDRIEVTVPPSSPDESSAAPDGEEGHRLEAPEGADETSPLAAADEPTSPYIDLRFDGMPPPTSDPAAGLPAPPPLIRQTEPARQLRAPGRRRRRGQAARQAQVPLEGRWVNHRLRYVSPWSVLKVVTLFYFCIFLMFMVAGVLLWNIARSTETVDQVEGLVTRLGAYGECVPRADLEPGQDFETDEDCPDGEVIIDGFRFDDGTLFRSALFGGVVFVVAGTALTVLLTVLLNLLNDVTGGIRYATVRETVRDPNPAPTRSPAR